MPALTGAFPPTRTVYPVVDGLQRRTVKLSDGVISHQVQLYNATGGVLSAGGFYLVNYGGTTATAPNPRVTAPATQAAARLYVVSATALADVSWGWFTYLGYCDALVEGTTDVTAADFLKLVNAQVYCVKDATTRSTATVAIALAAQAANSAVSSRVFLLGEGAVI